MTSLVTCASARGMMRANKLVRSLCSTAPPRRNAFKQALKQAAAAQSLPELQAAGFPLLGLWASAGSPQVTELVALTPGLSWLVIDMEHAPNTLPLVCQFTTTGFCDLARSLNCRRPGSLCWGCGHRPARLR